MTQKETIRYEISEAFDFIRFLIKHPQEISQIKEGSEINIFCKDLPKKSRAELTQRRNRLPQSTYLSEHTFHRV